MQYLKIVQSVLACILVVLALAQAQDYSNYEDGVDSRVRLPIIPVQRYRRNHGETGEVQRIRRQGDSEESESGQRHRRQGGGHEGVTGPVHTFVKTDEHAHFKWGVRHHVGHEYAGRR